MSDSPEDRERVFDRIAPLILDFAHVVGARTFHAEELRLYVNSRTTNIAPGSPDRILRLMRQAGQLDYEVISRSESLYQFYLNGTGTQMNDMTPPPEPVTPAKLIEEYVALRDAKKHADETYAEFVKVNYSTRMDELETILLDTLNKLGVDSLAGPSGTVYKKLSTSVTIADAREFRRHIIGTEEWDLLDWRANKTAINDRIDAGEALPPGVNRTTFFSVGIRRKS